MAKLNSFITLSDGSEIFYRRMGPSSNSEATLLLVPGWAYSTAVFEPLQTQLSKSFDTICIDPRGHGRSSNNGDGHNYTQHGLDLAELVKQLNLSNIILLGWSLGCYDCLNYIENVEANGVASDVRAIILADESPKIVIEGNNRWGEGTDEEIKSLVDIVNSEAYLDFFVDYMKQGYDSLEPSEQLLLEFKQYANSLTPLQAANLLEDACRYDFRNLLSKLDRTTPLLFLVRKDWSEPARVWVENNCPNASFEVLGGHLALLEMPEEFHSITSSFLSQLSSR